MRRRALGGATLKSISDDVPILKQLKMIEEYEQASDPAYREECRRVFGEIWADVIRRMTTPEINSGEA